ncbi:MAG: hypothetical protein V1754_13220 [Pseudomonadota bacterium]
MNLVVLLKSVRHVSDSSKPAQGLGPCDLAALTTALQLGNKASITVISVGNEQDEFLLKYALDAGVTRAIRIWEEGLDEGDLTQKSSLLAKTIRQIGFDLILAGDRSANWGSRMLGPAVAHRLQIPHLSQVVSVKTTDKSIMIEQLREQELVSIMLDLPALITVSSSSISPIQIPNMHPILESRGIEVQTFVSAEYDLHRAFTQSMPMLNPAPDAGCKQLRDVPSLMKELEKLGSIP